MMSEFSLLRTNDCDLQAIVKGRVIATNNNMSMQPSYAWFETLGHEDDQGGQEENMSLIFNELEPLDHGISSDSPRKIVDSSMLLNFDQPEEKATNVTCDNVQTTIFSGRRKNKHKIMKVVQQAGGDRIVSDKWNWRKYGEKIIKGSPYPRSYYRCSNTGGCLARKQVEQSKDDPRLFQITYMEEHTHPYPTRRHSQAGRSTRKVNDYASVPRVHSTNQLHNTTSVRTATSVSSIKHDQVLDLRGNEDNRDGDLCAEYVGENGVCIQDKLCEDDFFAGLDYLEGLGMNFND